MCHKYRERFIEKTLIKGSFAQFAQFAQFAKKRYLCELCELCEGISKEKYIHGIARN